MDSALVLYSIRVLSCGPLTPWTIFCSWRTKLNTFCSGLLFNYWSVSDPSRVSKQDPYYMFLVLATLEMSPQPGPARENHSSLSLNNCVWMPVSVSSTDLDLVLLAAGLAHLEYLERQCWTPQRRREMKRKTQEKLMMLVHILCANERFFFL